MKLLVQYCVYTGYITAVV